MSGIIIENGHTITHNTKTGRYEIADLGGKVRAFGKLSQAKAFAKSLPSLPAPKAAPEVAATPPTIEEAPSTDAGNEDEIDNAEKEAALDEMIVSARKGVTKPSGTVLVVTNTKKEQEAEIDAAVSAAREGVVSLGEAPATSEAHKREKIVAPQLTQEERDYIKAGTRTMRIANELGDVSEAEIANYPMPAELTAFEKMQAKAGKQAYDVPCQDCKGQGCAGCHYGFKPTPFGSTMLENVEGVMLLMSRHLGSYVAEMRQLAYQMGYEAGVKAERKAKSERKGKEGGSAPSAPVDPLEAIKGSLVKAGWGADQVNALVAVLPGSGLTGKDVATVLKAVSAPDLALQVLLNDVAKRKAAKAATPTATPTPAAPPAAVAATPAPAPTPAAPKAAAATPASPPAKKKAGGKR